MTDNSRTFQLRYVGKRFNGARLPTAVLPDLGAFRDLIVAFAKDRWRENHADRQRLPRGFDKSITFDLIAVEEGSAMPKLDWSREQAQIALPGFTDELAEIVEQSFSDVVALMSNARERKFPEALSSEHISALNKFGAGLREDEKIEFVGKKNDGGNVIYLDHYLRKSLITHVRETYESRFEGIGTLEAVHRSGEIHVDTQGYGVIRFYVDPERISDEFDGYIGSSVQFDVTVELDYRDQYKGVVDVFDAEVVDEKIADTLRSCGDRLRELSELQAGWYDGEGIVLTEAAISAAKNFVNRRAASIEKCKIFPSIDGGINFEFEYDNWDYTVEVSPEGAALFYGVDMEGDDELDPREFPSVDAEFFKAFDEEIKA